MKKILSIILSITLIVSISLSGNADTFKSGTIGKCTWELDGTRLTIKGNSSMTDINLYNMPWENDEITSIAIEKGVTEIGQRAFSNLNVPVVKLPYTVKTINASAFQNSKIQTLVLTYKVNGIGSYAFNGCETLEHVWYDGDSTSKYNLDKNTSWNNSELHKAEWHAYKLGLVTENDKISSADALAVLHSAVGKTEFTFGQTLAGDVNGDDNISAIDALMILHYTVNKIHLFPIQE
ncbi:MAG: leucine-rich repeat protein [Clostridia bacterium]|nr:leucine-rich repeat protein [Clostridia bacterium]